MDISHEDLRSNLWKNTGETVLDEQGRSKKTNKIDDDGNAFIDDVHGWNFVSNDNKVKDLSRSWDKHVPPPPSAHDALPDGTGM